MELIIVFGAGIAGALGVILMAVSAHWRPEASLLSASHMLIFHASALLSLSVLGHHKLLHEKKFHLAALLMLIGIFIFAGDLCLRVFYSFTPFHYAAPLGGVLIIVSWLYVSIIAILSFFK